jgi:hypothetical protein
MTEWLPLIAIAHFCRNPDFCLALATSSTAWSSFLISYNRATAPLANALYAFSGGILRRCAGRGAHWQAGFRSDSHCSPT